MYSAHEEKEIIYYTPRSLYIIRHSNERVDTFHVVVKYSFFFQCYKMAMYFIVSKTLKCWWILISCGLYLATAGKFRIKHI